MLGWRDVVSSTQAYATPLYARAAAGATGVQPLDATMGTRRGLLVLSILFPSLHRSAVSRPPPLQLAASPSTLQRPLSLRCKSSFLTASPLLKPLLPASGLSHGHSSPFSVPLNCDSMAGDGSMARTPARATSKPTPSSKQRSIVSFFQKSSSATSSPAAASAPKKVSPDSQPMCLQETKANSLPKLKPSAKLATPVPSSDMLEPPSSQENEVHDSAARPPATSRLSPTTMTSGLRASHLSSPRTVDHKSPTRKVNAAPFISK